MSDIPRHEVVDPRFRSFVLGNAGLETLITGARWLEGPVWFADHDTLLVSDIPNDRILRWSESGGMSVYRAQAGFPNGQTRDRQGRLVTCSHLHRAVLRTEHDGRITPLAERCQGRRLSSPNDVVVKRDGTVWFTDPHYGIESDYEGTRQPPELPAAVYRFDPRDGSLTVMADDFEGPNGLCFSPDESLLYISESGLQFDEHPRRFIRVFDVADDGRSTRLTGGRVFHSVSPGYADGLRCDSDGHVWTGADDGVHCIHPSGDLMGRIFVPHPVSNLCFGGRHLSRLFLCAGQQLYGLAVNRRGVGGFESRA